MKNLGSLFMLKMEVGQKNRLLIYDLLFFFKVRNYFKVRFHNAYSLVQSLCRVFKESKMKIMQAL